MAKDEEGAVKLPLLQARFGWMIRQEMLELAKADSSLHETLLRAFPEVFDQIASLVLVAVNALGTPQNGLSAALVRKVTREDVIPKILAKERSSRVSSPQASVPPAPDPAKREG